MLLNFYFVTKILQEKKPAHPSLHIPELQEAKPHLMKYSEFWIFKGETQEYIISEDTISLEDSSWDQTQAAGKHMCLQIHWHHLPKVV